MQNEKVLMQIKKEKLQLQLYKIKDRYFRHSCHVLSHHGDCSIFRSISHYGSAACTCGFLHDLIEEWDIIESVFGEYFRKTKEAEWLSSLDEEGR